MGFDIMGTDHLKAPCICSQGDPKTPHEVQKGCPIHDLPVVLIENFDPVHRPRGYNSHPSGIEAIEVGRHLTADWFNAFKYVFRAEHKNGRQDVDKALWYAKDGVAHNFPVHAPSWRFPHQQKLQLIIDAETDDSRKSFFQMILIGNRSAAMCCIEAMLAEWPADE